MNSTTNQPNLLELAKQGNAQAIAALMNRQLQPKGITVKISLSGDYLTVVAESQELPNQQYLVNFIRNGLTNLKLEKIKQVFVRGQVNGTSVPGWRETFDLHHMITGDELSWRNQKVHATFYKLRIHLLYSESVAFYWGSLMSNEEISGVTYFIPCWLTVPIIGIDSLG